MLKSIRISIVFAAFILTSCGTFGPHYDYSSIDIVSNPIKETINPGTLIHIKTNDIVGPVRVLEYQGPNMYATLDEDYTGQAVRIAMEDIEEIGVIDEETYQPAIDPATNEFLGRLFGAIFLVALTMGIALFL